MGQAETYIGEIRAAIDRVAENPRRGRTCADVRVGYRRRAIGSHVLFHAPGDEAIDVVRIPHQRMDTQRHM